MRQPIDISLLQRQAHRSTYGSRNVSHRNGLVLFNGRLSDVFTVSGGVVRVTSMFMRITEAVTNTACNMAWVYDPEKGAAVVTIGSALNIANYQIGDWVWSELDGTALNKVAQNALLRNTSDLHDNQANDYVGRGLIVPEGGIDITLSALTLLTGRGEMWIEYEPVTPGAKIWPGKIHSTTTTSSSTSSTSSSTSSTASTSSSTSSTASTTSTTSSTASTTSTTSSTSSSTTTSP